MSKAIARHPESYAAEARVFEESIQAIKAGGFEAVTSRKLGAVKVIDAQSADGGKLSFWVKVGWTKVNYAAIQFGMFKGAEGGEKSDKEFVDFVSERVERMRQRGITHALLFHTSGFAVAMKIADLTNAYREQMKRFPVSARNTRSPTMWFLDPRLKANPALVEIVMRRAIPLSILSKRSGASSDEPESRSRVAEVELRVAQQAFRARVGERCGWCCVVTGSHIRELLDAAHLPGRDWHRHNNAEDGILLRADLHRLFDGGLASIKNGKFNIAKEARAEYAQFHGRAIS